MKYQTILTLLSTVFLTISPSYAQTVTLEQSATEKIHISKPALFPEDIKYNAKTERFIVGSFREGAVYEIDDEGTASLLVKDDRLISALGIQLDPARNRLYVATANLGASIKTAKNIKKLAGLGVYNLETGQTLTFIDLGALLPVQPHLANGITMDNSGNIYVTDSFSPVIYKVNASGEASIFLESETFKGEGINLNGIVYHPEGYLILAKKSDGRLFKIPTENPENFVEIKLPKQIFGLDGVTLVNNEEIVVVANRASGVNTNSAFALYSTDGWRSAQITGTYNFGDVYPTTNVVKGEKIYGMYSKIGDLVAAPADKKSSMMEKAMIQQIGTIKTSK